MDKPINIEYYESLSKPPAQTLFDFFGDQPTLEAFQIFIYRRGWKVVEIKDGR